ncbi:MAG: 4-hydroxythreonine-4-phosphate dehydrogenase PdxA [Negativicutes bacterium]|nr:4-hydroxythreonine-4-phosphate dehydrogenase PdxA [Negativicutes bacterium]
MKPVLGIFLGEAAGIGPEIVAKLCAGRQLEAHCRPVLIGDARVLAAGMRTAGVSFPWVAVRDVSQIDWEGPVAILDQGNLDPATVKPGEVNIHSGKVTGDTLIGVTGLLKQGKLDGLTYAPLNKQAMQRGGHAFAGDFQFFSHYLGRSELAGELNFLDNLWVSRVTSHIPLAQVAASLSKDKILGAVMLAHETISRTGRARPRIALAALNPHGGEGGLCGREELDLILPAVKTAREAGVEVLGPFSADTVFINAFRGDYDAVITMYHDQGHIAMKLMGFQYGVTIFGGLPVPLTTPAHGTAFDIAGKGVAKTDATEQAVAIAAKMAAARALQPGKT